VVPDGRVALNRECITPDVSRTYHFAYLGGHVYSYLQYQYYSDKSLNARPDVELAVDRMTFADYRSVIFDLMPKLRVRDQKGSYRTCFDLFPITEDPEERKRPYLLVFQMNHAYDKFGIHNLMTCLGLWDLDVRGEHLGTWRLFINGNPVLMLGYPYSEYSTQLMTVIGIAPVFTFNSLALERKRTPSLIEGENPTVELFGDDEDYEEYDEKGVNETQH